MMHWRGAVDHLLNSTIVRFVYPSCNSLLYLLAPSPRCHLIGHNLCHPPSPLCPSHLPTRPSIPSPQRFLHTHPRSILSPSLHNQLRPLGLYADSHPSTLRQSFKHLLPPNHRPRSIFLSLPYDQHQRSSQFPFFPSSLYPRTSSPSFVTRSSFPPPLCTPNLHPWDC